MQGRAGRQPAVSLYALSTRQPVVSMQQTHYDCSVLDRAETQGCKPYSGYKPNNFFSHTMYSSADFFSRCGTCLVCCITSFLFPVFHIFSCPYQSILQVAAHTRSQSIDSLALPKARTRYGLFALSFLASDRWNSLPADIRSCSSLSLFRKSIRDHIGYPVKRP